MDPDEELLEPLRRRRRPPAPLSGLSSSLPLPALFASGSVFSAFFSASFSAGIACFSRRGSGDFFS
eukprot:SAG31_NODE_11562_length_1017_cov_2.418301_2_plen_65_part_01